MESATCRRKVMKEGKYKLMRSTWIADNQFYCTNRHIGELYWLACSPVIASGQSMKNSVKKELELDVGLGLGLVFGRFIDKIFCFVVFLQIVVL